MNLKHIKELQQQHGILGNSQSIFELIELIETAAPTDISILIHGESGTGKEVIANAIHKMSQRKHQNFVAINCGALPENLIDSELFGYEKGAFTGAVAQKKGLFEVADGGTIFLDELGEMPLKTQVRLLRVLESGEVVRVGGTESIRVNVRVIAATHKNLEKMIGEHEFRRDLYYRLKAVTLVIPSLRARKEDIPILIDHFVRQFILSNHVIFGGFAQEAKQLLLKYDWHGNVRELKNVIESLLVLARGDEISAHLVHQQLPELNEQEYYNDFPNLPIKVNKSTEQVERELIYQTLLSLRLEIQEMKSILQQAFGATTSVPNHQRQLPMSFTSTKPESDLMDYTDYQDENKIENLSMVDMEKDMIHKALEKFDGNRRKAATALNISERTLYRKIKEYDIR